MLPLERLLAGDEIFLHVHSQVYYHCISLRLFALLRSFLPLLAAIWPSAHAATRVGACELDRGISTNAAVRIALDLYVAAFLSISALALPELPWRRWRLDTGRGRRECLLRHSPLQSRLRPVIQTWNPPDP